MRGIVVVLIVLDFVSVAGATLKVQERCGAVTTRPDPFESSTGRRGRRAPGGSFGGTDGGRGGAAVPPLHVSCVIAIELVSMRGHAR